MQFIIELLYEMQTTSISINIYTSRARLQESELLQVLNFTLCNQQNIKLAQGSKEKK